VSSDAKQLAFVRNDLSRTPEESYLVIAHTDGSGERNVALRKFQDSFLSRPAWSPDSKTIALAATHSWEHASVVIFPVEGGAEKVLSLPDANWRSISDLGWLGDGSGLIAVAQDEILNSAQLSQITYPSGQARRITNNLNDYVGISPTADSRP